MKNHQVILLLRRLNTLLTLKKCSNVLALSTRKAIQEIETWPQEASFQDAFRSKSPKIVFAGYGPKFIKIIHEILETGAVQMVDELQQEFDPFFCDLCELPGIGQTGARRIFYEKYIESMDDLRIAATNGVLKNIPAFGDARIRIIEAWIKAKNRDPAIPASDVTPDMLEDQFGLHDSMIMPAVLQSTAASAPASPHPKVDSALETISSPVDEPAASAPASPRPKVDSALETISSPVDEPAASAPESPKLAAVTVAEVPAENRADAPYSNNPSAENSIGGMLFNVGEETSEHLLDESDELNDLAGRDVVPEDYDLIDPAMATLEAIPQFHDRNQDAGSLPFSASDSSVAWGKQDSHIEAASVFGVEPDGMGAAPFHSAFESDSHMPASNRTPFHPTFESDPHMPASNSTPFHPAFDSASAIPKNNTSEKHAASSLEAELGVELFQALQNLTPSTDAPAVPPEAAVSQTHHIEHLSLLADYALSGHIPDMAVGVMLGAAMPFPNNAEVLVFGTACAPLACAVCSTCAAAYPGIHCILTDTVPGSAESLAQDFGRCSACSITRSNDVAALGSFDRIFVDPVRFPAPAPSLLEFLISCLRPGGALLTLSFRKNHGLPPQIRQILAPVDNTVVKPVPSLACPVKNMELRIYIRTY